MPGAVDRTLVGVPPMEPLTAPGGTLGAYGILGHLAQGGMANVWIARHHGARGFAKLVALKTILPEFAEDAAFEKMFLEEARLAALIRHPNVCEIFELAELDGLLSISMEWVDGSSLAQMLADNPQPIDRRIAARIVAQAAAGLHAAHELRDDHGRALNLVHRDVSPQNILISGDGHVKLSDFGIAKVLHSQRENTAVGVVRGKVSYMSPEQARNRPLDRRSDIFSLGVVLFQATLATRPFFRPKQGRRNGLASLLRGEYPQPREIDPEFPEGLAAIIQRTLKCDPEARYATAAELRRDLEEWLLASGPLITESDVARVLHQRCGKDIAAREALIRAGSAAPIRSPVSTAPVVTQSETTASTALALPAAEPRPRTRSGARRAAYLALGAVALGMVALGVVSRPYAAPQQQLVSTPLAKTSLGTPSSEQLFRPVPLAAEKPEPPAPAAVDSLPLAPQPAKPKLPAAAPKPSEPPAGRSVSSKAARRAPTQPRRLGPLERDL